jgi:hypothetical protein
MEDESQVIEQDNTTTAVQEIENQDQATTVESADQAQGEDETTSNLADTGESEEAKFAKEYIGKPETYDYKDVTPEGMELNKDLTEKFNFIAGKYNMSQKGANELMALATDLAKQTQDGVLIAQSQQVEAKKEEYIKTLQADKEIGGAKLDKNLRTANLAYEKFIPNDVQDLFAKDGLNCHPSVVKMFYEVGKQMQNDTIHSANNSVVTAKINPAESLYGNTTPKTKINK